MLYARDIIEKVIAQLFTPDILILLGSRQVGKTTILEIISNRLRDEKGNCIFLDLDLETNLEYFNSYENIIAYIQLQGFDPKKDSLFLFLDEFHRAQRAGKTLKNLYDHHSNIKIIATGSSSLEINKTISESMSGRKIVFRVFPLNFREFLVFKGADRLITFYDKYRIGDDFAPVLYKEYEALVKEKLIFGSFPEVVLQDNLERKGKKTRKKTTRRKITAKTRKDDMAKRKERRPLTEVLQPHASGLSPEELFQQAGFDENLVDDFYAELKTEVLNGTIIEDRPDQERTLLRLNVT